MDEHLKPQTREEKLPIWARDLLTRLRDTIRAYEGSAEVQLGPVVVNPYSDILRRRYPEHARVQFELAARSTLDVRLSRNGILVQGSEGLYIHPSASNSTYIGLHSQ